MSLQITIQHPKAYLPHTLRRLYSTIASAGCLLLVLLLSGNSLASAVSASMASVTINQATLISQAGQRQVDLPHVLTKADFAPNGGLVHYRSAINLPDTVSQPIGVYIPKVSLSGRLYVNGALAESCEVGRLEDLRCLHQPYLFVIPAKLWKQGVNTLDFEVYATSRQMNGLAPITVGDPRTLEETLYRWAHFIRSDLLVGVAWLSAVLGFLSLSMSLVHRRDRIYLWFGITSLVNALSCFNGFVTDPPVDIQVFNWFVFSIRLISVPLLYITFIAVFKKDRPWITRATLGFVILAPLAIWLSGNNEQLVLGLYIPMLLLGPVLLTAMIRWAIKTPSTIHWVSCILLPALFTCGAIDWWRLGGRTNFEGIYLAAYAYGLLLLAIWVMRIIDVSEEQKLEQQLRESESLFRSFFNLPLVGTAITSVQKGWVEVNDQTCQILGYPREELFKKDWAEITHPDDLAADVALFNKMIAGEIDSYSLEKRFIRADGTVVPTILSGGRSRAAGPESEFFYIQIQDITTLKERENELIQARNSAETAKTALQFANEELQRMTAIQVEQSRLKEREQLLQDMHDGFGSQLASVRILAEQGRLNADQLPNYLQEITADLHLIVDTLSHEDISLASALMDMRYRFQRRFAKGSPHLHWKIVLNEFASNDSRFILHVLRIIQEAFNNAIRHASPENIWLEAVYDVLGQRLTISVRDDGIGMPAEIRPGRGLNNMQQRAREIGAELQIQNAGTGTEIRLMIELSRQTRTGVRSD